MNTTHLALIEAHAHTDRLRAEAEQERLAHAVAGPRSWWRRLLGLPAPADSAHHGHADAPEGHRENRPAAHPVAMARCGA